MSPHLVVWVYVNVASSRHNSVAVSRTLGVGILREGDYVLLDPNWRFPRIHAGRGLFTAERSFVRIYSHFSSLWEEEFEPCANASPRCADRFLYVADHGRFLFLKWWCCVRRMCWPELKCSGAEMICRIQLCLNIKCPSSQLKHVVYKFHDTRHIGS